MDFDDSPLYRSTRAPTLPAAAPAPRTSSLSALAGPTLAGNGWGGGTLQSAPSHSSPDRKSTDDDDYGTLSHSPPSQRQPSRDNRK